jgi:hypothetical protein
MKHVVVDASVTARLDAAPASFTRIAVVPAGHSAPVGWLNQAATDGAGEPLNPEVRLSACRRPAD